MSEGCRPSSSDRAPETVRTSGSSSRSPSRRRLRSAGMDIIRSRKCRSAPCASRSTRKRSRRRAPRSSTELIVRETGFGASGSGGEALGIPESLRSTGARRSTENVLILNDVVRSLSKRDAPRFCSPNGRTTSSTSPLVWRMLHAASSSSFQGGMGAKADRAVRAQLEGDPCKGAAPRSSRLGDTSARDSTTPVSTRSSWRCPYRGKAPSFSYTGRLHRLHPGKREVRIFD